MGATKTFLITICLFLSLQGIGQLGCGEDRILNASSCPWIIAEDMYAVVEEENGIFLEKHFDFDNNLHEQFESSYPFLNESSETPFLENGIYYLDQNVPVPQNLVDTYTSGANYFSLKIKLFNGNYILAAVVSDPPPIDQPQGEGFDHVITYLINENGTIENENLVRTINYDGADYHFNDQLDYLSFKKIIETIDGGVDLLYVQSYISSATVGAHIAVSPQLEDRGTWSYFQNTVLLIQDFNFQSVNCDETKLTNFSFQNSTYSNGNKTLTLDYTFQPAKIYKEKI